MLNWMLIQPISIQRLTRVVFTSHVPTLTAGTWTVLLATLKSAGETSNLGRVFKPSGSNKTVPGASQIQDQQVAATNSVVLVRTLIDFLPLTLAILLSTCQRFTRTQWRCCKACCLSAENTDGGDTLAVMGHVHRTSHYSTARWHWCPAYITLMIECFALVGRLRVASVILVLSSLEKSHFYIADIWNAQPLMKGRYIKLCINEAVHHSST